MISSVILKTLLATALLVDSSSSYVIGGNYNNRIDKMQLFIDSRSRKK